MKSLREELEQVCARAFQALDFDLSLGALQEADRPDLADFQCNGALAVAKRERGSPREIACKIAAAIGDCDGFTLDIAGPGFLNFRVSESALAARANALRRDPRAMVPMAEPPHHILLDYGGPNIAKEMHVGHIRSSIIGQALRDILTFAGHVVKSDIHLGDWGLQMGQLICYVEDKLPHILSEDDTTPITMVDLQTWYPEASKLSNSNECFRNRAREATRLLQAGRQDYFRLWRRINEVSIDSLRRDFGWLGVGFDFWYGESRYQSALGPLVADCLTKGHAVESDGAIVIKMPESEKLPPLILRNSAGGYGYGATDIATLVERTSDPSLQAILYVVDARQSFHFEQVFSAARKIGLLEKATVEHIAFGTVNGTDGKPFKTRDGGTMRLADLINTMTDRARARLDETDELDENLRDRVAEQIARAAIKFGELSHDRERDYVFDIEQFLKFEGKTGPYLQYTSVRIRSLIARAAAAGIVPSRTVDIGLSGREVILALDAFPTAFQRTVATRKPSNLANHMIRLADACNKFYQQNRILHRSVPPEQAASWLSVLTVAEEQLAMCMRVLGLDVPEQM
jgi:arginyl-tRNA synthetase